MSRARLFPLWTLLILALIVPSPVRAQDDDGSKKGDPSGEMTPPPDKTEAKPAPAEKKKEGKGKEGRMAARMGAFDIDEALAKYDADKNGELSKEEIAALKAGRSDDMLKQHGGKMITKRFDTDGDGVLSDAEKATMDEKLGEMKQKVAQMLDQGLGRADTNQDGALSADEIEKIRQFQKARDAMAEGEGDAPGKGKGGPMGRMGMGNGELIAQIDTNADGTLSKDEIAASQQKRADAAGAADKDLLMTRFDEDKDGKLSPEEQGGYDDYVKLLGVEATQKFGMLMERFDANKDGALDPEELGAMKSALEGRMEGKGDAPGKGKKKKVGDKPEETKKDDMKKPADGEEMGKEEAK